MTGHEFKLRCVEVVKKGDVQVCFIDMKVQRPDRRTVSLHPKHLRMEQPADMNLFVITNSELILTNTTNGEQRVRVKIVFQRKITSEMMTSLLPFSC